MAKTSPKLVTGWWRHYQERVLLVSTGIFVLLVGQVTFCGKFHEFGNIREKLHLWEYLFYHVITIQLSISSLSVLSSQNNTYHEYIKPGSTHLANLKVFAKNTSREYYNAFTWISTKLKSRWMAKTSPKLVTAQRRPNQARVFLVTTGKFGLLFGGKWSFYQGINLRLNEAMRGQVGKAIGEAQELNYQ